MSLKLGLYLGYWGIGPKGDDALEAVKFAESVGYESVWVAESYGSDCVSVLAWLAGQTEKINLGAAIMQVPARPPAAAAMVGATIDTPAGLLTITNIVPTIVNGEIVGGTVSYSYLLQDNLLAPPSGTSSVTEQFTVTVTDQDNDSDTSVLDIQIVDDVPLAVGETDSIV